MPTYQYSCTDCGHFFEVFQSFSDDSLTECPECGGRLRKVFNAVGVVFKGSGFYRTDSRAGGAKEPASTSGSTSSSGTKADAGSTGGSTGGSSNGGSSTSSAPAAASS